MTDSEKGLQMTVNDASAPGGNAGGGRPPFDTSVANQARIYDYLLGGYFL